MHVVIISGAARVQSMSNTAKIINAFCEGLKRSNNTWEVWYLSNRRQWESASDAFMKNEHILFALPLYVENVPGILLEFLTGLQPKTQCGTCISFLLQGGFPEVSQGRCCEEFLKMLPKQLGCEYLSEKQIRMTNGPFKYVQKLIMTCIARRLGCTGNLAAKPFSEK